MLLDFSDALESGSKLATMSTGWTVEFDQSFRMEDEGVDKGSANCFDDWLPGRSSSIHLMP